MNENTKVKDCPHRIRNNYAMRGTDEPDLWIIECKIQKHETFRDNTIEPRCHFHGNCKLGQCNFYNEWSYNEVRKAFEELKKMELHRDAVLGVLKMTDDDD